MREEYLYQSLYNTIVNLCAKRSISHIDDLVVTVHPDIGMTEQILREYFDGRQSTLISGCTNIDIRKNGKELMTAAVDNIKGT